MLVLNVLLLEPPLVEVSTHTVYTPEDELICVPVPAIIPKKPPTAPPVAEIVTAPVPALRLIPFPAVRLVTPVADIPLPEGAYVTSFCTVS